MEDFNCKILEQCAYLANKNPIQPIIATIATINTTTAVVLPPRNPRHEQVCTLS